MAEVKIISLGRSSAKVDTSTAVTVSSGDYVDIKGVDTSKLLFCVDHLLGDSAAGVKFLSGSSVEDVSGPYTGGGMDDLVVQTTVSGSYVLGPLETHRFKSTGDRIWFGNREDGASATSTGTVTIKAYLLP